MDQVETRVRRLEDRLAISDLVVTYATLLDDRQWERVGGLFAHDGVFAGPNSTIEGRDAIVENFRVKLAPCAWTLHDPHGHAIEIDDDDHARGTVIGYSELGTSQTTLCTSIRYLDDYRREDGRWRFARRTVLSLYGVTVDDRNHGGLHHAERKRWPGRPAEVAELPDYDRRFPGYPG